MVDLAVSGKNCYVCVYVCLYTHIKAKKDEVEGKQEYQRRREVGKENTVVEEGKG